MSPLAELIVDMADSVPERTAVVFFNDGEIRSIRIIHPDGRTETYFRTKPQEGAPCGRPRSVN